MKLLILTLAVFTVVAEAISFSGPGLKPGVCPALGPVGLVCYDLLDQCTTDTSCPGTLKCCERPCGKRCFDPVSMSDVDIGIHPFPGCPLDNLFVKPYCSGKRSHLTRCTSDDDCLPTGQCCILPCGNRPICLPKPPACPEYPCGKNRAIKCQYGQVRDANDCWLCKCRQCPPGTTLVTCFENPCIFATCNNLAAVRCKANYCGGCFAVFYDINNNEVNCN